LSDWPITARFIESGARRVFLVARRPAGESRGAVLIVAPFAEEMNKSRRMLSETAMALAARGITSVLPDLSGTGDSGGEFANADWEEWRADLLAAARWSAGEGWPVTAMLGVRMGCLLAAQIAGALPDAPAASAFWQPVTDGERFLTQFLRLRAAASAMAGGAETVAQLRQRLKDGEQLEIAGYDLSPRLAAQLAQLRLAALITPALGSLAWFEVVRADGAPLPEPSQHCIEAARQAGVAVAPRAVAGEPFWSSTEIVTIPALVALTADALGSRV
jgi:exosortase A-associated hydrolase 2